MKLCRNFINLCIGIRKLEEQIKNQNRNFEFEKNKKEKKKSSLLKFITKKI